MNNNNINLCSCLSLACLSAEGSFLHPLPLAQKILFIYWRKCGSDFLSLFIVNIILVYPFRKVFMVLLMPQAGVLSSLCSLQRSIGTGTLLPLILSPHCPTSLVPWVIAVIINLKLRFLLNNPSDGYFAWMKEIKNKVGPLFPSGPLMDLESWCVPWMDQWHFWTSPRMNLGIHSVRRKRYSKHSENLWSYFRDVLIQLKYQLFIEVCSNWFPYYRKCIALVCFTNHLKRVIKKWICGINFCSGKNLENIHLLTHHYTSEVILWPRKQEVGASKHYKITLSLAYMQVFLNWLIAFWLFFLSLLLATRALNFIYFTHWFSVSWKHKEKKSGV